MKSYVDEMLATGGNRVLAPSDGRDKRGEAEMVVGE